MKESIWGYAILTLGILAVGIIWFFANTTRTDQHNYALLKETTEAAMMDAVDLAYYRQTGNVRIEEEKFVENFIRRFAENADLSNEYYKIEIYDVNTEPPKVSLKVSSGSKTNATGEVMEFNIVNNIDAILETEYLPMLPDEYQQLEFIESTGEQYINTKVAVSYGLDFEFVAECTSEKNRDGAYFGSRDSVNEGGSLKTGLNANGVVGWLNTLEQDGNTQVLVFRYGVGPEHDINPFIFNTGKVYFKSNNFGENVNYVSNGKKMSYQMKIETVTHTSEIILMGVGMGNGKVDDRTFIGKTYYFKIYRDGTLIRDFVPCYRKSDEEVGLYDVVNGNFYGNDGKGKFTAGPKIQY